MTQWRNYSKKFMRDNYFILIMIYLYWYFASDWSNFLWKIVLHPSAAELLSIFVIWKITLECCAQKIPKIGFGPETGWKSTNRGSTNQRTYSIASLLLPQGFRTFTLKFRGNMKYQVKNTYMQPVLIILCPAIETSCILTTVYKSYIGFTSKTIFFH